MGKVGKRRPQRLRGRAACPQLASNRKAEGDLKLRTSRPHVVPSPNGRPPLGLQLSRALALLGRAITSCRAAEVSPAPQVLLSQSAWSHAHCLRAPSNRDCYFCYSWNRDSSIRYSLPSVGKDGMSWRLPLCTGIPGATKLYPILLSTPLRHPATRPRSGPVPKKDAEKMELLKVPSPDLFPH